MRYENRHQYQPEFVRCVNLPVDCEAINLDGDPSERVRAVDETAKAHIDALKLLLREVTKSVDKDQGCHRVFIGHLESAANNLKVECRRYLRLLRGLERRHGGGTGARDA